MITTGVARVGCRRPIARRDLAVDRQRVAEPREAEHRRVAGGATRIASAEIADQVAQRLAQPRLVERVGDAEHRRLDLVVRRRLGGQQRADATSAMPTYGTIAASSAHADQPLEARAADRDLAGEARRRRRARERHERQREREHQVLERRRRRRRAPGRSARRGRTAAPARGPTISSCSDQVGEHEQRGALVAPRAGAADVQPAPRRAIDRGAEQELRRRPRRSGVPEHRQRSPWSRTR